MPSCFHGCRYHPGLDRAAVAGLFGATVGGAAAVVAQVSAGRHERNLAEDAWDRQRKQWSFEQEVATNLGLLAQLREFDRYHARLMATSDFQEAAAIPRPQLEDADVDRVNAFASEQVRNEVSKAMEANRVIRELLATERRLQFAAQAAEVIAAEPYREFRAAHGKIVEMIRMFMRSQD